MHCTTSVYRVHFLVKHLQGISISYPTMPLPLHDEGTSPQIYHPKSTFFHHQAPGFDTTSRSPFEQYMVMIVSMMILLLLGLGIDLGD